MEVEDKHSVSSAESHVAHVNDDPRLRSHSAAAATSGECPQASLGTKPRLSDVLTAPLAYPTESIGPADSRSAAAPVSAASEKRNAAPELASPNRPPSAPHERRSSVSGDSERSTSSASNKKLYFHTPTPPAAAQAGAAPTQVTKHAPHTRTDTKPLRDGAVCTPSPPEEGHERATSKPAATSLTPNVKPVTRTPTHPSRREDAKDQSLSFPSTSDQVCGNISGHTDRQNSAALAHRVSQNGSGAAHNSLSLSRGGGAGAGQRKSPRQLVARMSVSQSNAGAMVPYVDSSDEPCSTAYNREYGLTMVDHNPPSLRVAVQRYVPTARTPEWNSNLKEKKTAPLEVLPRISLSAQQPHYARAHSASDKHTAPVLVGAQDLTSTSAIDADKHRVHSLPITPAKGGSASVRPHALESRPTPKSRHLFALRYCGGDDIEAYRDELGDALNRIDFKCALSQLNAGHVGGDDYQAALAFFSLVAKDKLTLFPEDLHELLVLFTPPGVAVREAEDFLWEECENKTRLSFAEFLLYGTRLRDRVFDYELFTELNDIQRLLVTYARVFPGRPSEDRDYARIRLLAASRDQLGDQLPDKFRPLRVYEHLFLVDYQHMLYRAGVIRSEEVPPEIRGDLPSDVQAAARERRRQSGVKAEAGRANPAKEDIEWGTTDRDDGERPGPPASATTRDRQVGSSAEDHRCQYPSIARCNATAEKEKGRKRATTGGGRSRSARGGGGRSANSAPVSRSTEQLVPGCISSRARGGSGALRRPRTRNMIRNRQRFEVRTVRDATMDNTIRHAKSRYMGRTLPTDYSALEQQDSSLIQRLQLAYNAQK